MTKLITPPDGLTESEEADWWYANRETVSQEFQQAFAEGRVRRGPLVPPSQRTKPVELDPEDARRVSDAAQKRGLDYQTYLKKLIHEGLDKDAA